MYNVSSKGDIILTMATDNIPMDTEINNCEIYDKIIEGVFMGLLCIFGFCGNTLSMICLSRDRSKTATPFLLVTLEAVDTFFLFTVVVLRVMESLLSGQIFQALTPYLSKYMFPLALVSMTAEIYMTVLVTVNRYICVCRPYKATDLCSRAHAQKHVIIVFTFSFVYNLPRFFEYDILEKTNPVTNETVTDYTLSPLAANQLYRIIYGNVLYFIVMFLIPLSILICLNYQLMKALQAAKRRRASMQSAEFSSRSEEDITLTLIVVVLVFVFTQTPALVTQLLLLLIPEDSCPHWLFYYERLSDLFVVFNSAINFIIYCFCSRRFRQILAVLVCPNSRLARQASFMHHASYRNRSISVRRKSQDGRLPLRLNRKRKRDLENGVGGSVKSADTNQTLVV